MKKNLIIVLHNSYMFYKDYREYLKNYDYDKNIIKKDLSEYEIIQDNNFNKENETDIYELINKIRNVEDRDIILFCKYNTMTIDKMNIFFEVIKDHFNVSMIQIVESLKQLKSMFINDGPFQKILKERNCELRKYFSKLYDGSVFTNDKFQSIYLTEGFSKIYSDHIIKVKKLMFDILNSYDYDRHDSDKMIDDSIFKSYNEHYVELKKIPYLDESGNRNQAYIDFEDKYLHGAMTTHCANELHHFYDWKNLSNPTLLTMLEAIVDVYASITAYQKEGEDFDIADFCNILSRKHITDNLNEKIMDTVAEFKDNISKKKVDRRVPDSSIKKCLEKEEGLYYIKNKNDVFYKLLLSRTYLIDGDRWTAKCKLNEKGEFVSVVDNEVKGTLIMVIREGDEKIRMWCNTGEEYSLVGSVFVL